MATLNLAQKLPIHTRTQSWAMPSCHELQHLIGCYYILFSANQIQEILLSDKNIINMSNVRRCGGWVIKLQFGYKGGLDQYLCLYPNIDKPLGQIRFLVNCPPTPPLSQRCLLLLTQGKMLAQGRGRWSVSQKPQFRSGGLSMFGYKHMSISKTQSSL